jgi:hypothetical protein
LSFERAAASDSLNGRNASHRITDVPLSIVDVGGDFIVERDGSGGVAYRNIGGTVRMADRDF